MDIKYLLCESNTQFSPKAKQAIAIQTNELYHTNWFTGPSFKDNEMWNGSLSSPKSTCSSISTYSSSSSSDIDSPTSSHSSSFSYPQSSEQQNQLQQDHHNHQSRRRTASDVSIIRHRMFIYSHPHKRPRSESSGNNNAVQTRTPWTPFEDQLLQQGYDQGLSWAMISSTYLPHRSRGCCWGRFKTLQNKNLVDPNHSHMRHFRRPWKAIDFTKNNNCKKNNL